MYVTPETPLLSTVEFPSAPAAFVLLICQILMLQCRSKSGPTIFWVKLQTSMDMSKPMNQW